MDREAPGDQTPALITIDAQVDTLDGQPLEVPGTSAAMPNIAALCAAFRAAGLPIVHAVRLYEADGSNAEPSRRDLVRGPVPVFRPGTAGRSLAPGLTAEGSPELDDELLLAGGMQSLGPGEVAMYKPRWGAFYRTPLEAHLRRLSLSALVFAGCNFPNCPRTSIYEASERDYRVVLASDAVSGLYERGRSELIGIDVACPTTHEILADIEGLRTTAAP